MTADWLAYWGEAFTHSQFDWGTEDLPAAQKALTRLAATRGWRRAATRASRRSGPPSII